MPSLWWDCAPLMAAECLAGRVPLVAPRLGGLGEAVRDEVDGLLFDGLDAGDLARQLDRLAGEPGLLERLQAGIEAPRPFAEYVDELEAYYAGERPSRAPLATAAPAVTWQGDHGLHTSLSHINNEVTARLRRASSAWTARARRSTRRCPTPPTSRCATSGRPTCARRARAAWPSSSRGSSARSRPSGSSRCTEDVDEVWVPSGYVRDMYLRRRPRGGPRPRRAQRRRPRALRARRPGLRARRARRALRFLFVGGAIGRKGVDVLLAAWQQAFAGRDDVQLVIKDFGSGRRLPRRRPQRRARAAADGRGARRAPRRRPRRRGDGRAVPRLRRARASLPRRGLRHAGARGDGQRPARHPHRRRPDRRVLPAQAGWRIRVAARGAARRPRGPLRDRRRAVDARARRRRTSPSSCARPPTPAPRSARRRGAAGPLGRPALRLGPRRRALRRARRRRWPPARPRAARAPSASSTARPPSWPRRPGAARTTSPALLRAWTQAPADALPVPARRPGDRRRAAPSSRRA